MKIDFPIVFVCMITYNHERFIAKAIEGVLMQEADFEIELIIADDASLDRTEEIVQGYIHNHPNGSWIKYTKHPENLGMIENFIWALKQCERKYIAICEGDDYWTDPLKLQKQVSFLEANPNFVLTYHPVDVLFLDGRMEEDFGIKDIIDKSETNIYDLASLGNYIHTPSVVFSNVLRDFPKEFYQSPLGDFFLYMLLADYGLFKKLDKKMAVYRYGIGVHSSSSNEKILTSFIKTRQLLLKVCKDKTVKKILENRIISVKFWSLPNEVRTFNQQNKENYLIKNFGILILFTAFLKKSFVRLKDKVCSIITFV